MVPRTGVYGRLKIIKAQATSWVSVDTQRLVVGRAKEDSRYNICDDNKCFCHTPHVQPMRFIC